MLEVAYRGQSNSVRPFKASGSPVVGVVVHAVLLIVLFADANSRGETDNSDETKQQEDNVSIEESGQSEGVDFGWHPRGKGFN